MQCGDILGFVSNQAENHPRKYKLHVLICVRENIFLFINTSGNREGVMFITQDDWPEMLRESSFISCRPVQYPAEKIKKASSKGRLSDAALNRLMDHLEESEILTANDKEVLVDAIADYLR